MALEQVFSCPRTLAKLRANPLGRILEGFCLWLLDGGFTRGCIRQHRKRSPPLVAIDQNVAQRWRKCLILSRVDPKIEKIRGEV